MSKYAFIFMGFWVAVIGFLVFVAWMRVRAAAYQREGIRHGRGVFLTFDYAPGEWEYYTRDLAFRGAVGTASFGDKNVYLKDDTEEVFIELFGPFRNSPRLREVALKDEFIVFRVRTRDLDPNEKGEIALDHPGNVEEFFVLIPEKHRADGQTLLEFYRMLILKNRKT
ncbi:MAG: hypothetical protein JSS81_23510 [Acidobacteria bacterium]|nr:hypothetical protein [Acidobacteriota bacterium]